MPHFDSRHPWLTNLLVKTLCSPELGHMSGTLVLDRTQEEHHIT